MSLNASIYNGLWTDWGRDSWALGATLTLPSSKGKYLISIITFFITICGSQCWGIVCRVLFRIRATEAPKDGLRHQHQAILRNSDTEITAMSTFAATAWHWRGNAKHPMARSSWLIAVSAIHLAAFTIAGIFSSQVSPDRTDFLLDSVNLSSCGSWNHPHIPNTTETLSAWDTWAYVRSVLGNNLAVSQAAITCMGMNSGSGDCTPIGRRLAKYSAEASGVNATMYNYTTILGSKVRLDDMSPSCPFTTGMCTDGVGFTLDSGYVDSYHHLGINSAETDRILFNDKLHCAPLTTDRFSDASDSLVTRYYYSKDRTQVTFYYSSLETAYDFGPFTTARPFTVAMVNSRDPDNLATFDPISQLTVPDSNTILLFLRKDITYMKQTTDPWFQTTEANSSFVGVLGCVNQRRLCVKHNDCSPIWSDQDTDIAKVGFEMRQEIISQRIGKDLDLNARQMAMLRRVNLVIPDSQYFMPNSVSSEEVLANNEATGRRLPSLPNTQWMKELENWFAVGLHMLQLETAQFVTPLDNIQKLPLSDDEKWMCRNQLVFHSGHISFNILGLMLIFIVGGILILGNLGSDFITLIYDRYFPSKGVSRSEWKYYGLLQLQRYAYEGHCSGNWFDATDGIPITKARETFKSPLKAVGSQSRKGGSDDPEWSPPIHEAATSSLRLNEYPGQTTQHHPESFDDVNHAATISTTLLPKSSAK